MKFNTAVGFILAGIAFYFLLSEKLRIVQSLACIFLLALGTASIYEDIFQVQLGIDQLIVMDKEGVLAGNANPGRPAPGTSFCFILTACAFFGINSRKNKIILFAQYLLHCVTLISIISIIGYILNVPTFYKLYFFSSMAIHTTILFFLLSTGASLINPDKGITALFMGNKIGNVMIRHLFPQMLLALILIGWLRMFAYRNNIITEEFGIALLTFSFILTSFFLLSNNVKRLNHLDDARRVAEEETIKLNSTLKKTVKDLETINKELESFNYISSHDMQEPLRKIKNFVRVLLKDEKNNLSEEGRYYLERMADTSQRMQSLIEDLLTYHRIKNSVRNFRKVNLNTIIENVIVEFKEIINEKKVIIKTENLCEANVIPFQVFQLFYSLIENSLKFAHPNRRPQIIIRGDVVLGKNINPKLSAQTEYCHITIKDNGIGFDPKYKEKIFEIFQRLYGYGEYPGTGIGLAICKKIVEIHNGIITANSEMDNGAQFDVYLPIKGLN